MPDQKITFIASGPEHAPTLIALDKMIFPLGDVFAAEDYAHFDVSLIMADGRPVGSFGYVLDSDVWPYGVDEPPPLPGSAFIMTIGILPNMRGKGIGRRAMEEMLSRMRDKGQKQALSCARASDERSHLFHAGFGFREVERRPDFYPEPNVEDAIVFYKELSIIP